MPMRERDEQAQHDGLHSGDGRVFGILFADAPGDHGGGGHGDAEADGEDQRQHGLGDPMPTVATALAPRRPTQKTSTTAKSDSSTISRTMGMASSRMARLRLPAV
jgi:hypothetical protein